PPPLSSAQDPAPASVYTLSLHDALPISLLSCLPSREVDRWLTGRTFMPYTPYTVTTQDGMRELISSARRKGYALLEQQLERKVRDRKSTRLNSSHVAISYAVFCLKKKNG